MSSEESREIIDKGLKTLQIEISPLLRDKIVGFSSGFPHYIHLLCKFGCEQIIEEDRNEFTDIDLDIAINKGIGKYQ